MLACGQEHPREPRVGVCYHVSKGTSKWGMWISHQPSRLVLLGHEGELEWKGHRKKAGLCSEPACFWLWRSSRKRWLRKEREALLPQTSPPRPGIQQRLPAWAGMRKAAVRLPKIWVDLGFTISTSWIGPAAQRLPPIISWASPGMCLNPNRAGQCGPRQRLFYRNSSKNEDYLGYQEEPEECNRKEILGTRICFKILNASICLTGLKPGLFSLSKTTMDSLITSRHLLRLTTESLGSQALAEFSSCTSCYVPYSFVIQRSTFVFFSK